MPTPRDLDVVLFGATGYTGRLVADYLATAPSARELRWAIAGRDREKLGRIRDELRLPSLELLVADAHDRRSLDLLAARARVVCTTVGPYARHGDEIVAACVRAGTHLTDLSGETAWIRRTIDEHHAAAVASGAKIVHASGFDSIPSDLGVFLLDEAMRARGRRLARVDAFFGDSSGGISGGTLASTLLAMDEGRRDPRLRRLMLDPYSLVPGAKGPDRRDLGVVRYEPRIGRWTAPFMMAVINGPIVRRSNALLGHRYGREFRYHEALSFSGGARGALTAAAVTAGIGAFFGAMQVSPLRKVIEPRLPQPGAGPSPEVRARGRFAVHFVAEADTSDGSAELTLHGRCADARDPGYGSTAVMLAEASMCLAKDALDEDAKGGVLTPASAMGNALVERLKRAGMTWEVG